MLKIVDKPALTQRFSEDEIARVLRQVGLPAEGLIRFADLAKAKIVHDYGHLDRLKELGFPPGGWLSSNLRVWTPDEIGTYLLSLPTERPVMPARVKRQQCKTAAEAKATSAAPPKRRGRR